MAQTQTKAPAPAQKKVGDMKGAVKWFNEAKGFGFITPDIGGGDVFVHYTGIIGSGFRTLENGARVCFDVVQDQKGPKAVNVSVD